VRPVSSAFLDAVVNGGARVDRAYILPGDGTRVEQPMVSYNVTASRSAVARYSGTVVLSSDATAALVQPYGARIQIMSGFNAGFGEELVAVATMRIDDVDTDQSGQLSLTCFGLEKVVEDNRFWTPQVIDASSALGEIRRLIQESLTVDVVVLTQSDALAPRSTYDRDRWPLIDGDDASLARAIGAEVYCDAIGSFVVRRVPTLEDTPVWTVTPETVLVSYASQVSRKGVYNVVVATGDRVASEGSEVATAIVPDDNPRSPTYYRGPFGAVVRHYSSPFLVDYTQAFRAAKSLLAESQGLARSLSFTNVPNLALEPGDVVLVTVPDGIPERHIIDAIQFGSTGVQQCDTRMTQVIQ
jgi:hypothetical protein